MKFVDLSISLGMLNFPHPLFAYDVNLHGTGWHSLLTEVQLGGPAKKAHHQKKRDRDPSDLNGEFRKTTPGSGYFLAPPVLYDEVKHWQQDHEDHEDAEADQGPVEVIHLPGKGRTLRWKNRKVHGLPATWVLSQVDSAGSGLRLA